MTSLSIPQLPRRSLLALAVAAACLPAPSLAADGLFDLGTLGGSFSNATGVSDDGSVVVGLSTIAGDTAARAYRWTGGVMTDLGTLGGLSSDAQDVSADGSVVVGGSFLADSVSSHPYRWTQSGGMVSLGTLGGSQGWAYGVSADGTVVVGDATTAGDAASYAFRWTQAGGMISLGALNGGVYSRALGVSADGAVVVGEAADGAAGDAQRAYRWTQGGGMVSLGTLNGGSYSVALGVSADGAVVVGDAGDGAAGDAPRAYRWTQGGGMISLGTLNGGSTSSGLGASADGAVVVGRARDGAAGNANRAFRWTQATGMQTVEQWLTDNGVVVAPTLATSVANATNGDGSVVVGTLANSRAFIARVAPPAPPVPPGGGGGGAGTGLIDVVDYNRSLQGASYVPVQAISEADIVLHGLHGSPMRGLLAASGRSVWLGGDWGRQENVSRDGDIGAGEVGIAYGISDAVMLKLALGRTYSEQDLIYDGEQTLRGTYLVPELIVAIPGTALRVSASGYYNDGEADIDRGYENAGTRVESRGSADYRTAGLRLRLDWLNAVQQGDFSLSPYVSATHYRTKVDGYTERGGGFPVRWDSRSEHSTLGRLGTDAAYALNGDWTLLGRLEAVHRFDDKSEGSAGQVIGLYAFDFDGLDYKRDWVRAAIGAEGKAGPGTVSVMLNASTETNGPTHWAYASYRIDF